MCKYHLITNNIKGKDHPLSWADKSKELVYKLTQSKEKLNLKKLHAIYADDAVFLVSIFSLQKLGSMYFSTSVREFNCFEVLLGNKTISRNLKL